MLLIFDLDDTLIETTNVFTAKKLENALKVMIADGLAIKDFNHACEMLLRMNQGANSTKNLILEFVELHGGNKKHVEMGMQEIEKINLDQYSFDEVDEVIELLEDLKRDHLICLVTRGKEEMQREKLRIFGLDESLFCEIVVTPYFNKGEHYAAISAKYGIQPHDMFVIGDRIEADLLDAKKMGAHTVHIRQGRGANCELQKEIVDHTIYELGELVSILENQEKLLEIV